MAERWIAEGPFGGLVASARGAHRQGPAGLVVEPRDGVGLVSLHAYRGRHVALADALGAAFGVALPSRPRVEVGEPVSVVWSGPQHWLLLGSSRDLAARIRDVVAENGLVTEQTGSRGLLRLSGGRVRDVLAKGCSIDLHPRAFPVGHAAVTAVAQIGVQIWQPGEGVFDVAVPRSYAASAWSWLTAAANEFGMEVRAAVAA